MKKYKRKINWTNIILAIIFLACAVLVIYDLFIILIQPIITSYVTGWTWWGLITFIIALVIAIFIFEYFVDYYNNNKKDL